MIDRAAVYAWRRWNITLVLEQPCFFLIQSIKFSHKLSHFHPLNFGLVVQCVNALGLSLTCRLETD